MPPHRGLDQDGLREIARSVRLAQESMSLAGSLAHSDPDEAWNVSLEARDHCASALADLAEIGGVGNEGVQPVVALSYGSRDVSAVYRLIALLKRTRQPEGSDDSEGGPLRRPENEGHAPTQLDIINHVADLCKEAVEEGMTAHSLATATEARDAAWTSVMASVEALYALLLIGAALPKDLNFDEGDLDLGALHVVEEINVRVLSRAAGKSL